MAWHSFAPIVRRHGIARRVAALLLAGVLPIAPASMLLAQEKAAAQPTDDHGYGTFIAEASQRFGIPADWIRAVMHTESEHVDDVSAAGAAGLMQIMPDTWTELRRRYNLGADPFDPHDNIIAGAAYLRELLSRYDSVSAMLAAYNAGPSRYDEYRVSGRPLPAETRKYVTKLAPLMGGKPLPVSAVAALPAPGDWRDAPLFVMVAGGGSPAGKPPANHHPTASRQPTSGSGDTPSSTLSSSIFVPVTSGHSAP